VFLFDEVNRQPTARRPETDIRGGDVRERSSRMKESDDRRVRRTRAALREALISLMSEKGYDAVTVQDVIDRSDVGRSTFYAHYTDKADLLGDLLDQLRGVILPAANNDPPDRRRPLRFSLEMFRHVSDQRVLLLGLIGPGGTSPVVTQIEGMLHEIVRGELDQLVRPGEAPRAPLDLVAASVVASFLSCLRWWVDTDFTRTPEQMDVLFQALVAPGVRGVLGLAARRPSA
jgi:AcrR family transcriptional regulator